MNRDGVRIGTAGWSIASRHAAAFDGDGTHLERYARVLGCAEINSSFYRPHRRATYERWAQSVPDDFRFAVKLPKAITHEAALKIDDGTLDAFIGDVGGLGSKLGVLLAQLPPSLAFDPLSVDAFLTDLAKRSSCPIAIEPRHESWGSDEADTLLKTFPVARVAADPARFDVDSEPAGGGNLAYFRFHGTPRIYYSDYGEAALKVIAGRIAGAREKTGNVWCIFDNTAAGHALGNALRLMDMLRSR